MVAGSQVVELWLAEPISAARGLVWPKYADGRPFDLNGIQEPCHIVIHFPSGRKLELNAKAVTMTLRNGVLNHIAVVPLTEPVPFHEATRRVRDWAESWGVLPSISAKLSSWEAQNPKADVLSPSYSAKAPWDDSSQLFVEVKPFSPDRGWYVVLNFDLTGGASDRVRSNQ